MKNDHLTTTSHNCKRLFFVLTLCAWLSHESEVIAQPTYQIPVGVRPRSMGEAFVAVADDGNAIRWNPAGLARLEFLQLNFAYAKLFNAGVDNYYASFISRPYFIPALTDYIGFGFDWHRLQASEEDFSFDQNQFNFALAFKPPSKWPGYLRHLSLGVNGKYFTQSGDLNGNRDNSKQGPGWDLGVLYNLEGLHRKLRGVQFGLMINDVNGTFVRYKPIEVESDLPLPRATREKILPENLRWGFSYRPFEFWPGNKLPLSDPVLAVDVDDRWHVGLEFWLVRLIAFRAGWQKDRHTDDGATLAFGLGLRLPVKDLKALAQLDYAMNDAPSVLDNTNQGGVGLVFKNDPRLLRIHEAHLNDVFASLYKHYAYETDARGQAMTGDSSDIDELGYITLENTYAESLVVTVTLNVAPYTKKPVPQTVVVPGKNGTHQVALRAFLDKDILTAQSHDNKTAEIVATYSLLHSDEFKTQKTIQYMLHGPGFLTWDDPAKAAAFVTKNDKCLNTFAKGVVTQEAPEKSPVAFFSRNMSYALKVYEALNALNYRWVKDRTATPFHQVGKAKQVVDQIQYPADLLASPSRAGDCDDLAVLYASLLESVGVETALLVTPTHLFMMLNTDIPGRRLNSMPVAPEKFFAHRGTLWLPMETTLFPVSFTEAWHEGAMKAHEAFAGDSLQIVEIGANQTPKGYEPADVPFACTTPSPNIVKSAEADFAALADTALAYLAKFETDLRRNPGDLKRRNEYAAVLGQNGERQKARLELTRVRAQDPKFAPGLNNLGNLAFIEGRYAEAESLYDHALRYNPYNKAGTYLNLALLYAVQVDTSDLRTERWQDSCRTALKSAGRWLGNDPEQAALILGLALSTSQGKGGKSEIEKNKSAAKDSTTHAAQDTARFTPQDESGLLKKLGRMKQFIGNAMKSLLEGREPDDVMLNWAGPKGEGIVDEDRARLLWWET